MNSPETTSTSQEEHITIVLKRSTRNVLLTKLITAIALTAFFSSYFISLSAKQYEEGKNLTVETYAEKFEQHKVNLMSANRYASNIPLAVVASFITICFLVGSYELITLLIGFLIGKLTR
jgi:hypothetical protein